LGGIGAANLTPKYQFAINEFDGLKSFIISAKNCWHSIYITIMTKTLFMRSILYLIAIILVIGWLLGAFVYNAGSIIHILLVLAIVSLLLGFIRRGTVD